MNKIKKRLMTSILATLIASAGTMPAMAFEKTIVVVDQAKMDCIKYGDRWICVPPKEKK